MRMTFNFKKIKEKTSLEWNIKEDMPWQGAVLFLFLDDHILLIKRSEEVPYYRGHLAFLGGHREQMEVYPIDVALREFEEETHLSKELIEVLGVLPPVFTKRSTLIIPLLARLHLPLTKFKEMVISNGEWSVLLGVPWWKLADENLWRFGLALGKGGKKDVFLFRSLGPSDYTVYTFAERQGLQKNYLLWGATAKIVWNFFKLYYS